MELTKQRKILIGVLLVGLSGLGIDRLFLAAPENALASEQAVVELLTDDISQVQDSAILANAAVEQALLDDGLPSYAALTDRLIDAQRAMPKAIVDEAVRDPFALPQKWQADPATPTFAASPATEQAANQLNAVFKLDGTVRSVIDGKAEIMAVISGGGLAGQAIRVGQNIRVTYRSGSYEDFTLVEVGSRFVVWKSNTTNERLEMKVDEVL